MTQNGTSANDEWKITSGNRAEMERIWALPRAEKEILWAKRQTARSRLMRWGAFASAAIIVIGTDLLLALFVHGGIEHSIVARTLLWSGGLLVEVGESLVPVVGWLAGITGALGG